MLCMHNKTLSRTTSAISGTSKYTFGFRSSLLPSGAGHSLPVDYQRLKAGDQRLAREDLSTNLRLHSMELTWGQE